MQKALLVAAAMAIVSVDSAQAEIGVLAAVNRDMTGARPSEEARPIFIKEKLVQDERIVSTGGGGGQVLFLDQTSLTIAPNSEIVLDRYIYDPESDSGEMTVTVLKGAMRFVGGRISKTSPATIRTSTATIGIRGGMGNINVGDGAETVYMHVAGFSSTITSATDTLTITREGGLATIGAGGDLQYLGVADDDFIATAFRPGAAGQGGGGSAAAVASTVNAATGQVAEIVSADPDAVTQNAISTVGEKQTVSFGELTVDVDVDLTTEFSAAAQMMDDLVIEPPETSIDSFLATGSFATTVVSEGLASTDPNAFFQLIYNANANEGVTFFSIPDTGDALTSIEGDQFSGVGDQFLVRLGSDGQFVGNTGLATALLGDPSGSSFLLNGDADNGATLDGSISVDYANSTLVQFLEAVDGDFSAAQVRFIESFLEPGVTLADLQADLDQGLADFKQILQPLP